MLQRYAQFCKAGSSLHRYETCYASDNGQPLQREATILANAKPKLIHTRQGSSGHQLKDANAHLYMPWSDTETSEGSDKPLLQSHNDY